MAFFTWPPLSVGAAGLATEAQQIIQTALLTSIDGKDFATLTEQQLQTAELVSIDAKVATQTTVASIDAKVATETTLSSINTKTPALGQATMANSTPVVIASNQSQIPVIPDVGEISTNNSSTTPLGSGATFTGTADEVTEYAAVGVFVSTDQDGTLIIEHSTNNTTWDKAETYALDVNVGGTPEGFFFQTLVMSRFTRVRYTNGGTAQGVFRLQTILKRDAGTAEVNAVSYPILSTSEALVTKSVIYGLNSGGGGTYVAAKVTPSGAVNIEGSVTPVVAYNAGNASATTQRVVIATDQSPVAVNPQVAFNAGNASATTQRVVIATDQALLPISQRGRSVVTTVRNNYASTPVTTGAWVQLVASLGSTVNEIEIFDSSGQTLELGIGAAASEARLILVFPGGNGRVPVTIASGTRVSIRAVSATADVGELLVNLYA